VHANAITRPHALVVLWAQVPMGIANGCGSMLSGSVIAQAVRMHVHCGVGGALLQQWHLWLADLPPSVREIVWRIVVLADIWATEQGRKCLWSLVHPPPRQGVCCAAGRFQRFHLLLV
jgi:hypothetical protein